MHFYYTLLRNANYENHNTNSISTQGYRPMKAFSTHTIFAAMLL